MSVKNAKKGASQGTPKRKSPARVSAGAILPERNQFDDAFLDVVGKEFKFDHAKGLAEWMKNSVDAYVTTTDVRDHEQYVLLRFKVGNPKKNSVFECIDFVGMAKENIDKALKIWGLRSASKRGKAIATFGGHGNGGKFYMRQMFANSRFITFRGGLLNVFGFDEKKHYGYAKGYENVSMTLDEALTFAGLDSLDIPAEVLARWEESPSEAGFTVVRGEGPERFSGKATVPSILERLRVHPQARRILRHKPVIYLGAGDAWGTRLELPDIQPREGFEEPREIPLPKRLRGEGEEFDLSAFKGGRGKLTLRTSAVPLSRSGELAAMNTIDVMGEVGCIGSYRMNELGFMRYAPESEFILGELEAPFLEDSFQDSVANDREKLVRNPLTDALLAWVREQVDELASEMAERRNSQKKNHDLKVSALFNQLLDRWKNQFMVKLTGELFGGSGIGDSFGGTGGGGGGGTDGGRGNGGGGGGGGGGNGNSGGGDDEGKGAGDKGSEGGGDGTQRRAGPRFPRVLLSDADQDPLSDTGETLHCDERHPPIYQRAEDIAAHIYWINTQRPLATKTLQTPEGANSVRWREYLFQRYVEIILKQTVYEMGKRDPDLTAEKIDVMIDEVTSRVHNAAAEDLETFLFDDHLTGVEAESASAEVPEDEAEEAA